jgi:hypothetical protein
MKILPMIIAAALPGQWTTILDLPGGPQTCPTASFSISHTTLTVHATQCLPDRIFANGFEG